MASFWIHICIPYVSFQCGVNAAIAYLREHVGRTPEKHFSTERLISISEYQKRNSKDEDDLIGHNLGKHEVPDILISSLETSEGDKDDKNSHLCIESTLEEEKESEEIGANRRLKQSFTNYRKICWIERTKGDSLWWKVLNTACWAKLYVKTGNFR